MTQRLTILHGDGSRETMFLPDAPRAGTGWPSNTDAHTLLADAPQAERFVSLKPAPRPRPVLVHTRDERYRAEPLDCDTVPAGLDEPAPRTAKPAPVGPSTALALVGGICGQAKNFAALVHANRQRGTSRPTAAWRAARVMWHDMADPVPVQR